VYKKILALSLLALMSTGCVDYQNNENFENGNLKMPSSVVVCRAKQCAPAKAAMSSEYIYNSLSHLLTNNNRSKALVCESDGGSRVCTEAFVSLPVKVGITPAHMYIDSVKITDVTLVKGAPQMSLVLNYNVSINGQTPECTSSKTLLYVKSSDNIIMEDSGYNCKMTSIGTTSVKTLFAIDYIDLDYGYIGGYYSIGLSGPASGGGTGYMLIRLAKDAYPLSPALTAKGVNKPRGGANGSSILNTGPSESTGGVKMYPIKR
jgi:hypothetical protein